MKTLLYVVVTACFAGAAFAAIPLANAPAWTWSAEDRAYGGMAFADVDADGDLDLICGCYNASNWYPPINDYHSLIFFNAGGTLASTPSWTSGVQRHCGDVSVGDISGDGKADTFFANGGTSYQPDSVHYGKAGGPNVNPDWSSAQPAWATGSCLGDVNGDGRVDAATSNQGNSTQDPHRPNYIFFNSGTALAATPGWISSDQGVFSGICLGDVDGAHFTPITRERHNGDGASRVFYLRHAPLLAIDAVRINGRPASGAYAYDLYAGWISFCRPLGAAEYVEVDYTYSTRLDVAVAKWSSFDTCVYFNATGVPATSPGWTSGNPANTDKEVIFVDYDGDDDQDLFVGGSSSPGRVYRNNNGVLGTAPVWQSPVSLGSLSDALIADFNGDGRQDLVVANYPYRGVSVWENDGDGFGSAPAWQYTGSDEVRAVAVGDVNGDGAMDLAVGFSRKPLVLFLNNYAVGIKVADFRAAGSADAATVTWSVGEGTAAGFDLYRRAPEGAWDLVNPGRITGSSPFRYVDAGLAAGEYQYKLRGYDLGATPFDCGPTSCRVGATRGAFAFKGAHPNPRRGATTFIFTLPVTAHVELEVYDLSGRTVATPAAGEFAAGEHTVDFDTPLPPGLYLYRFAAAGETAAGKLAIVE